MNIGWNLFVKHGVWRSMLEVKNIASGDAMDTWFCETSYGLAGTHINSRSIDLSTLLVFMLLFSFRHDSLRSLLSRHLEQVFEAQCVLRTFPLLVYAPAVVLNSPPWPRWPGQANTVDMPPSNVSEKLSTASQCQDQMECVAAFQTVFGCCLVV